MRVYITLTGNAISRFWHFSNFLLIIKVLWVQIERETSLILCWAESETVAGPNAASCISEIRRYLPFFACYALSALQAVTDRITSTLSARWMTPQRTSMSARRICKNSVSSMYVSISVHLRISLAACVSITWRSLMQISCGTWMFSIARAG